MADHPTDPGKLLNGVPSLFEKIIELRFFYLIAAFIFALDSSFVYFYRKNLLALSNPSSSPEVTIGNTIVFIGVFSFFLGLFFPFLRHTLRFIISLLGGGYLSSLVEKFSSSDDKPGYKSILVVEHKALLEHNEFDLKMIAEHREEQRQQEKMLDLVFAMTILFVCNRWIFGDQSVQTITQVFASLLERPMGFGISRALCILYGVFLLLAFGGVLYGLRPIQFREREIYLPKPEDRPPKVN